MKILIVGPSWVGDMVMAQALFISLQQRHPNCEIDVLAPAWCKELLSRMPEVHATHTMPLGHGALALGLRRRIGKELEKHHYDQAIVLPNSFKSALIPWFAGIRQRTGWRGEARGWLLNDCRSLNKAAYPLMVQRFVALAYPADSPLPDQLPRPALLSNPEQGAAIRQRLALTSAREVAVLCPGAEFGPAKQWPARHYAKLAAALVQEGKQVWLLGSANDKPVAQAICEQLTAAEQAHCLNLCDRTTLGEAVDLLAQATVVVSNDSGLMHIAAALARPVVVLYGSTSAAFTPPLALKVKQLSLNLSCSPCFKRECPLQHLDCLNKLEPQQVLAAANELIS